MQTIDIVCIHDQADFFQHPEDAIRHGATNPRASRAREELAAIQGARVLGGRCTLSELDLEFSNGVRLCLRVQGGRVNWQVTPRDEELVSLAERMAPMLLRTRHGQCVFDPEQMLSQCVGREVLNLTADASHVQLLLTGLPLPFFPNAIVESGGPMLTWCDLREPEEQADE